MNGAAGGLVAGHELCQSDRPRPAGQLLDPSGPGHAGAAAAPPVRSSAGSSTPPRKTLHTGAQPRTIVNRNDLLLTVPWINGVKTGYTLDAGYVLVASGTRKGVTLLSVVMGAPSEAARDQDTLSLLRYGFSLYLRRTPVRSGETLASPPVRGRDEKLPLVARPPRARGGPARPIRSGGGRRSDRGGGPNPAGRRLGTGVVTLDGHVVARVPLVSKRSALAPAATRWLHLDDAIPGPRALAWVAAGAVAVAIVIGIALGLTNRRRDRGQPGPGRTQ